MDYYIGTIMAFPSDFPPSGWSLCDGSTLLITGYPDLFNLVGTTFGGDGTTTFGVPDLRGRSIVGFGTGTGLSAYTFGQTGGAETQLLTTSNIPSHTHTVSVQIPANNSGVDGADPTGTYPGKPASNIYNSAAVSGVFMGNPTTSVGNTGGNTAFDIRSPYIAMNYCICLQGTVPLHPYTVAFVNAVIGGGDTLSTTEINALDQLVKDLTGSHNPSYATSNMWSKFAGLYPFVGGTATSHKWNLKDPRDLDAAHRITWTNSPTHSANGVQFDGSTNYGQLNASTLTFNEGAYHFSFYNRKPATIGYFAVGQYFGGGSLAFTHNWNPSSHGGQFVTIGGVFMDSGLHIGGNASVAQDDRGLFTFFQDTPGVDHAYWRDGTVVKSDTTSIGGVSSSSSGFNLYIGGASGYNYCDIQCAFCSFGNVAFSATDAVNYYNAIQAFQTALSRAV